jgi:signal peptidase I
MKEDENPVKKEKAGFKKSLWEFVKFFIIAAIIVVPIRLWVAQPFIVSGSSMTPNFEHGEYLIIDEFSYHFRKPQRGEVIIFRYPQNPSKFFIKRVIGLPEEKVQITGHEIYIYNKDFPQGMQINESYQKEKKEIANLTIKLGNGEYFVLGDNRLMSSDSRIWGPLHENLIIGRAWIRLWPINKVSISF